MIFVTGCARSGTSLIAKILQAHGAYLGRHDQVNVLYENTDIRQMILKPYLSAIGADPLGQRKLPKVDDLVAFPNLREKMEHYLGLRDPRAYKDAKLTFVWPIFAGAFPMAKWVIVRRDKEFIVDSCLRPKTSEGFHRFMRASDDRNYWRNWVDEHEARFTDMLRYFQDDAVEVWTDDVVRDPCCFYSVAELCGLEFDVDKVRSAVSRHLWHSKEENVTEGTTSVAV